MSPPATAIKRIRAEIDPPWGETLIEVVEQEGPFGPMTCRRAVTNPARPRVWLEIIDVRSRRVRFASATKTVAQLRSVLAPGERVALARRDGADTSFKRAVRKWAP